ncbi:hypothetical protein POM88_036377 [Heracleum sosnowskyi]|uniref:Uncharacterized protein n=1 Tax=Heracleum sosnowskyi TaxID=360622 RepID=A0AAD8HQE0_9APIA|nr:hypothetical protein POM88_036377 [Heracleum sosnowskyi]
MQSISALFALLALLLIANTSYAARPGMGQFWHVMKGEALPMNQELVDTTNSGEYALINKKIVTEIAEDIVHEILTVDKSSDTMPEFTIGDSQHLEGKNSYVDESDPIPDTTMAW